MKSSEEHGWGGKAALGRMLPAGASPGWWVLLPVASSRLFIHLAAPPQTSEGDLCLG